MSTIFSDGTHCLFNLEKIAAGVVITCSEVIISLLEASDVESDIDALKLLTDIDIAKARFLRRKDLSIITANVVLTPILSCLK